MPKAFLSYHQGGRNAVRQCLNGAGFLGIRASQVVRPFASACCNDSTRYAIVSRLGGGKRVSATGDVRSFGTESEVDNDARVDQ